MTKTDFAEWLRDRIWPTLVVHPSAGNRANPEWPVSLRATDEEVLKIAYEALKEEMKSEDERIRIVETKLLNISSLAPIAMTVFIAMITFLTSGKVQTFTRTSIWVVVILGGYIALQFLLAVRSAIKGLARKPFYRLGLEDWFPKGKESRRDYLERVCKEITDAIANNRKGIDQKVSQLALSHESILNAVGGLLIMLFILLAIVATQPIPAP
jgi:hypothetical protein